MPDEPITGPLDNVSRTAQFWGRASSIYLGYKLAQLQELGLRAVGWDDEKLKEEHWNRQHARAADDMYSMCVDLRGFFLKVILSPN